MSWFENEERNAAIPLGLEQNGRRFRFKRRMGGLHDRERINRLLVDLGNHIATRQSGDLGRKPGLHADNDHAQVTRELILSREGPRDAPHTEAPFFKGPLLPHPALKLLGHYRNV